MKSVFLSLIWWLWLVKLARNINYYIILFIILPNFLRFFWLRSEIIRKPICNSIRCITDFPKQIFILRSFLLLLYISALIIFFLIFFLSIFSILNEWSMFFMQKVHYVINISIYLIFIRINLWWCISDNLNFFCLYWSILLLIHI